MAEYVDATDTTAIVDHYVYDAFGNETDHTGSYDFLFKYTGRAFDQETGLQNNLNRWFDPVVGRWLSEDPIGFEAGDANVYRYVGNFATGATDPDGLQDVSPPALGEEPWRPWNWKNGKPPRAPITQDDWMQDPVPPRDVIVALVPAINYYTEAQVDDMDPNRVHRWRRVRSAGRASYAATASESA